MDNLKILPEIDRPEQSVDSLVRVPGGHVSSIEQLRAKGSLVRRSLGQAPHDAIPLIGNGADRLDVRTPPTIR